MNPMSNSFCFYFFSSIFLLSQIHSDKTLASSRNWLIEFRQSVSKDAAQRIAKRYAMISRGPVMNDEHFYHFVDLKPKNAAKRKRRDVEQEKFLQRNDLVKRAIHQIPHVRVKRGFKPPKDPFFKRRSMSHSNNRIL